jgi:uncharacterized protein YjbI with pentapeptide repeats
MSSGESTVDLQDAPLWVIKKEATNLSNSNLIEADLSGADLSDAVLIGAHMCGAEGITNEELALQVASLEGATMPDCQEYEEWLKSRGEENSGTS